MFVTAVSVVAVAEPFAVSAEVAATSVLAESEETAVLAAVATAVVADRKAAEIDRSCFENKQAAVDTLIADTPIVGNWAASRPVEDTRAGSTPAADKPAANRPVNDKMTANSCGLNYVSHRMNPLNVHGNQRQLFRRTEQRIH